MSSLIICVMGVAGAGKSTVGRLLASELRCEFLDADSLHPLTNIERMANGLPLTDTDREPWLAAVHERILDSFQKHRDLVVACSALKERYRQTLTSGVSITWVYLKGSEETIRARLQRERTGGGAGTTATKDSREPHAATKGADTALCRAGSRWWLLRFDQRHIHQVLAQEPDLKLVGTQHVADDKIVGTIISKFGSTTSQLSAFPNDDLMGIQQT